MNAIDRRDKNKSKDQLIEELAALRQQVADYRHAQQSLAEKYQSYEFIVDTSRDFMTLINRDYIYEAANKSYCRAHQKTRDDIIGKSVAEVWGREKYEFEIKEHLDTCFRGQEAQYQSWFEFATLGRRYFDVIYYPYYGADGAVTHAVVVSRDNTYFKEVETQLVRSEQRYRLVSDLTSNYTYAFGLGPDDEFLLEWVTDAFSRITGFAPEEVNTRHKWIQLTHPDDVFRVDRRELALLTGQMNVAEFRIVSKSGEIRWVRDHIRPIWSRKQQRVVRLYGAVQDITERKLAEAERERFTIQLQTAAEVSKQLTAVLELDQLLDQIVSLLQTRFNLYHVHVYLLDETTDQLTMKAGSGEIGRILRRRGHRIPLSHKHSLVARAARAREIILVNDVNVEPGYMRNPLLPQTQSEASIPLLFGGNVLGVLDVQDDQLHRFQPTDLDIFNALAGQIAIAIRNARLVRSLRLSEERYELAASVGRVGVWDWDLKANSAYLTPNLKAMLGYEEHEIGNRPDDFYQQVHPDDLEIFKASIQNHFDTQSPSFALEYRMVHKDGTIRWMLGRGMALKDESGHPYRMTGAHTDITELKEVETALQYRIALEAFVTTMSTRFISLPADEIDNEINQALGIISKFVGSASTLIITAVEGGCDWNVRYMWQDELLAPTLEIGAEIPIDDFSWGLKRLVELDYLHILDVANLPAEAQNEKDFLQSLGFNSFVAFPMFLHGSLYGLVGLANISKDKAWQSDNIGSLNLVSQMFVNALERKRVERQVQASLQEKEILLKEIHHRVKNNLQIVSSLLYLQSQQIEDDQIQEIFRESQNRITSMALIHENLYQTEDLVKIDLAGYISNLVDYLFQAYVYDPSTIDFKLDLAEVTLDIDIIIPCGLIITELISNFLRYAFPVSIEAAANQSNKIWISLAPGEEEWIILTIGNNGRSLPEAVDNQHLETLGLKLVTRLVQQLRGTIEADHGPGNIYKIVFPLSA